MTTGIKTITFAMVHFSVALTVGWIITGSFVMGSLLAVVEPAVNTVAYAIHEGVWSRRLASGSGASDVNVEMTVSA